jgi:cellulose synthase/poly-beta-1,6-N-acetylglucosamine synthase-like glycosyltransferase
MSDVVGRVGPLVMYACFLFGILHYVTLLGWGVLSRRLLARQRAAIREHAVRRTRQRADLPGVTMILPAYNEEVVIVDSVRSVLAQDYPDLEVIVVSDGSKDSTVAVLVDAFAMERLGAPVVAGPILTKRVRAVWRSRGEPRLVVIDKDPAGAKADGANCGINYASKPWCVVMDADELVDPKAILRCMTQVAYTPHNVVGVGVTLLPTNECTIVDRRVVAAVVARNAWVGLQTIEYLGAFFISRPGMSAVGAMPIVSGGFGLFRRDALLAVGGYHHGLGEDLDLVVRMHRHHLERRLPYRIMQVPEAVVWTEFPSTRQILRRQRIRWHRGLRQVMDEHREVVGRPSYGTMGMFGMFTMYAFEWIAVLVEALGYVLAAVLLVTGTVQLGATLQMYLLSQVIGVVIALSAVHTAGRSLGAYRGAANAARLVGWALVSQLGYRQLTVWWRIRSLVGKNGTWGAMPRTGFGTTPGAAPAPAVAPPPASAAPAAGLADRAADPAGNAGAVNLVG